MRIAICYEDRVRPDSTGIYLLSALRDLGHQVDHYTSDKTLLIPDAYDFYLRVDDGLPQRTAWNPKLHPSAYYVIDTHIESDWRIKMANDAMFDYIFCCQKAGTELPWDANKYSTPVWLPAAADPKRHYVGKREKKYDVCFIGNFHSQFYSKRMRMVDEAFRVAPNFYFGSRCFEEMAEKYAESRIVLNQSLNNDINMRFYEAQCSGSALLTDHINEIPEIGFVEGRHYFSFPNDAEGEYAITSGKLKERIEYLLANESIREEVAECGMREVHANHTYVKRCERILETIKSTKPKEELCLQP